MTKHIWQQIVRTWNVSTIESRMFRFVKKDLFTIQMDPNDQKHTELNNE